MKRLFFIILGLSSFTLQAQVSATAPKHGDLVSPGSSERLIEVTGQKLFEDLGSALANVYFAAHPERYNGASIKYLVLDNNTSGGVYALRGYTCNMGQTCPEESPQFFVTEGLLQRISNHPEEFPEFAGYRFSIRKKLPNAEVLISNLNEILPPSSPDGSIADLAMASFATPNPAAWVVGGFILLSGGAYYVTSSMFNPDDPGAREVAKSMTRAIEAAGAAYGSWLLMSELSRLNRREVWQRASDEGVEGNLEAFVDLFRYRPRGPQPPRFDDQDKWILVLTMVMSGWLYREWGNTDAATTSNQELVGYWRDAMVAQNFQEPEILIEILRRMEEVPREAPFYDMGRAVADVAARLSVIPRSQLTDMDPEWPAGIAGYRMLVISHLLEFLQTFEGDDLETELDSWADMDAETAEAVIYVAIFGRLHPLVSDNYVRACQQRLQFPALYRLVQIGTEDISSLGSEIIDDFLEQWDFRAPETGEWVAPICEEAGVESFLSTEGLAIYSYLIQKIEYNLRFLTVQGERSSARQAALSEIESWMLVLIMMADQPNDCITMSDELEGDHPWQEGGEQDMKAAFQTWLMVHGDSEDEEGTIRDLRRHLPLLDPEAQRAWNAVMDLVSPAELAVISDVPLEEWFNSDSLYGENAMEQIGDFLEQMQVLQELYGAFMAAGLGYPDAYVSELQSELSQYPVLATALRNANNWFVRNHGFNLMGYRLSEIQAGIIASNRTRLDGGIGVQNVGTQEDTQPSVGMNEGLEVETPEDLLPMFNVKPGAEVRATLYESVADFASTLAVARSADEITQTQRLWFGSLGLEATSRRQVRMLQGYDEYFQAYAIAWQKIVEVCSLYDWNPEPELIQGILPWLRLLQKVTVSGGEDIGLLFE